MALVPCSACGRLISDLAQRCPQCDATPVIALPTATASVASPPLPSAPIIVGRCLKRIWSAIPLADLRHKRFLVWTLLFLLFGGSGWLAGWSPSHAAFMGAIYVGVFYAIYRGWCYVDALDRAAARSRYVWGVRSGWMLVVMAAMSLSRAPIVAHEPFKRVIKPGNDVSAPSNSVRFRPELIVVALGLYILEHSARAAAVREQTLRQQPTLSAGSCNEGHV